MTDPALKAAVEQAEREYARAYGLDHITVSVGLGTLRTLLDALSSQASVMEAMAKALEDIQRNSYVGKAGKPVMRSKFCNYPAHLYHSARTALSQYRSLGDRHDD